MARKRNEYFETFVQMVDLSCQAARSLQSALANFDPAALPERRVALHQIEHDADEVKHAMMHRLAKEFVTPIEREDIIQLANEIDEVTDKIEDVLIRVYMYNIKELRPEALAFADVIVRCCDALLLAMQEFHNFQKSEKLQKAIIEVNDLEEEGDTLYIDAVRRLYSEGSDPVAVAAWSEAFDRLEDCCDACEHVAGVMETVVMKNS